MAGQEKQNLWTITPFEKWVEEEGIPVITQQYPPESSFSALE